MKYCVICNNKLDNNIYFISDNHCCSKNCQYTFLRILDYLDPGYLNINKEIINNKRFVECKLNLKNNSLSSITNTNNYHNSLKYNKNKTINNFNEFKINILKDNSKKNKKENVNEKQKEIKNNYQSYNYLKNVNLKDYINYFNEIYKIYFTKPKAYYLYINELLENNILKMKRKTYVANLLL